MLKYFLVFLMFVFVAVGCHSQQSAKTSYHAGTRSHDLLPRIFFEVNDVGIKDMAVIRHNAAWLKKNRDKVVILEGHCDERGDHEFNLHLGDRRARSVMKALLDQGIHENQLILVSYGKKNPLVTEANQHGWAKNRRVEFVIR